MRIKKSHNEAVLDTWRRLYNYKTIFIRCDILEKLTNEIEWLEFKIEEKDLHKLFIISSDD